jgi:hypothetical protein
MSTISASTTTTTAYVVTADTTGTLVLQTGATPTTALTIDTSQNLTLAGTLSTTGITNTGVATATRFNPTGSSVTGNGMYLPAANSLGLSTNGTNAVYIDSSQNVGIGVTPSSWAGFSVLQISRGSFTATTVEVDVSHNGVYNSGWKYIANGYATNYYQANGQHIWQYAASGTAGNTFSFTQAMTLDASGNLGVGLTPSAWSAVKALQLGGGSLSLSSNGAGSGDGSLTWNAYYNGTNWIYYYTGGASNRMKISETGVAWFQAPSGTAGGTISYTQAMALDASGNLQFNSGYGSATTAYGVRAWARFNGTAATINASGGISSVTRASAGTYTVNLSFTAPDTNYTMLSSDYAYGCGWMDSQTTTSFSTKRMGSSYGSLADTAQVFVALIR